MKFLFGNVSSIGKKFVLVTVLFSSCITLIFTCAQVYLDYRDGVLLIERHFTQIKTSYLASLTSSVWRLDMSAIDLQMDGILKLPDVEYVEIESIDASTWSVGTVQSKRYKEATFELKYEHLGAVYLLGTIRIVAGLDSLYARLIDRVLLILGSNAIKTFFVSLFILWMFQRLVGRHLRSMACYVETLENGGLNNSLELEGGACTSNPNELEVLAQAINTMRKGLKRAIEDLINTNTSLTDEIEARKNVEKALHEREASMRALIANTPAIVYMKDRDGRFIMVNERLAEMLGRDPSDLEGQTVYDVFADDIAKEQHTHDQRVFGDGAPRSFDEIFPHEDGVHHYISVKFPIFDIEGEVVAVAGISTDVTDRKRAEEYMQQALAQAEIANKSKSAFLANMSHEIRTPLNGLMGMLQLLNMTTLDEKQKDFIKIALQSSKRLLRLLSDILDLSKVEAGKIEVTNSPFDFKDVVEGVMQLFIPLANEKGLELSVHIPQEVPSQLVGDAVRLQQVLSNLVGNAIKFTNTGRVEVEVNPLPQMRADEYRVLFSVSDTGIGMEDALLNRLCTPFTQGETSYMRKFQGAGLGLAIANRLVNLLGGNLSVESEVGKGSTFHFFIPFKLNDVCVLELPREQEASLPQNFSVLYAEDDTVSQHVMVESLEELGLRIDVARDGEKALEKLKKEHYDIVLMDIQMPILNGLDASKAIRQGRAGAWNQDIPIIALTAYAMDGDKEMLLETPMNGYVSKPVQLDELKAELTRVYNEARNGS